LNPLSNELELMAIAVALYLYDCTVLLYSNEGMLVACGGGWRADFGFREFLVLGRALSVLNPLTPHRPAYRLRWTMQTYGAAMAGGGWELPLGHRRALAAFAASAAAGLFVLLPYGLFVGEAVWPVVAALVVLYGSIGTALGLVQRQRQAAGLSRRQFAGLAFECLACPPFGINLVRRIAMSKAVAEPLPHAAARLLDAAGAGEVLRRCEDWLGAEAPRDPIAAARHDRLREELRDLRRPSA
jgi:hypothetical protein